MLNKIGDILHEVETKEKILKGDPTKKTGSIVPPFNAFTASGKVKVIRCLI